MSGARTWIAADTLTESVPPLLGAAARFLLAALLCLPVIVGKRLSLPRGRALGFVLLLSVTMIVLPYVLVLWAQRHVSSVTVTVLFAAMPLLVALLTPDDVPRGALLATVVGLGGIVLAMGPSFSRQSGRGRRDRAAGGGIHRHFCSSCPPGTQGSESPGSDRVAVRPQRRCSSLLPAWRSSGDKRAQWNHNAIGSLVFLALVAGAPAYATYFWLLQHLEAYKVTTVQWIEPLVAIIETAFFLRLGLSFSHDRRVTGYLNEFVTGNARPAGR